MKTKRKPPTREEASSRFAQKVAFVAANSRCKEFHAGYDQGVQAVRDLVEGIALRAALSDEPDSDTVEQVLMCVLAKIDRENPVD